MDETAPVIWDWNFAFAILPDLLKAFAVTIEITLTGSVVAMVLGLVFALCRRSTIRAVALSTTAIIEFVRSTPLLVQLYFLFYVLPFAGVTMSVYLTGLIGLGVHYACYTSEVYRAGIESVPRAQWDAARALNFSAFTTWRSVILPQALPTVLPALGNYVIAMFKEVSVLSAITLVEVVQEAKIIGSTAFRYTEPMTLVGILYLLVSYPSARLIRRVERWSGYSH